MVVGNGSGYMILIRLRTGKLVCYNCLQETLNNLTSIMGGALLARRTESNLAEIANSVQGVMRKFLYIYDCTHYAGHYLDY